MRNVILSVFLVVFLSGMIIGSAATSVYENH